VFLEYALKEVGIDPRKHPFTIKITGGPDGDVAGNMLRIINRDYGENARVVGISDATGVAEDPKGLNWAELMRLVTEGKPLSDLDPSKGLTSSDGRFGKASEQEGLLMRNTMHLRVKSDAFVPAGGRPAAINANNWKAYLDPTTQQPSSSVIVEGANLFLTPQARKLLSQEAKCLIVKDSSANKCGVVTSSYEVLGGMILTQEQFLSVKEEYVRQVLQRLRYIARSEASLLMREWRSGRSPVLPDVCVGLSYAIIRVADAVETQVHDDDLLSFVASLLPLSPLLKALKIENPAQDDYLSILKTRLPAAYLRGLVSKVVASECIYREGIEYFDAKKYTDNAALGARAIEYIRAVERINGIVKDLRKEGKGEVADILKVSGPRAVMEFGKEIL
jgi:glutamate dehydrogenase